MGRGNRTYYVEATLDEISAGYYCFCHSGLILMEKRFFSKKEDADNYGNEWTQSRKLAYG